MFSKLKTNLGTRKGKYVIIDQRKRYIESVSKAKGGFITVVITTSPLMALRTGNPDAFLKKYGLQHYTAELYSKQ